MKRLALLAALALTLTGCVQTVSLRPAEFAVDPLCAQVMVDAPSDVAELPIRETNAQGTLAWGSPAAVLLRCGVPEPDPTATLPCYEVGGVFWLVDDAGSPNYVYTTYGRSPATEVILNRDLVAPAPALLDVSRAVAATTATSSCTEVADTLE
ncbi:DUF3515 family protein [Glaciihabitans arcticus]|uniref:DUF3515 family protein n=1 Tax=Glaciihabitans arcticus TaxID=2668039 RepID=A0A4Q9GUN3_9MICO|nr:DUF3515 family protein [Glaciihabitans arcticus]